MFNYMFSGGKALTFVLYTFIALSVFFTSLEIRAQEAAPAAPASEAPAEPPKIEISAKEYGVILNLSGKQRMLTQKMSKETLLVVASINEDENRTNLKKNIDLFIKTLAGLKYGDSAFGLPATDNDRIRKQLDKVKSQFDELAPIFTKVANGEKPSTDELNLLKDKNVPLLVSMNKAVKMYERKSKKVLGGDASLNVIINLAGKQRMLTQKMSKEFLFIKLGIALEDNKMALRETVALFDKTLTGLEKGDSDLDLPPTTDAGITAQLHIVQGLWGPFKSVVEKAADVSVTEISLDDAKKVAELNLPLLKNMNKAVKMYEGLAK